MTKVICLITST